jgi:hypothetical protein
VHIPLLAQVWDEDELDTSALKTAAKARLKALAKASKRKRVSSLAGPWWMQVCDLHMACAGCRA